MSEPKNRAMRDVEMENVEHELRKNHINENFFHGWNKLGQCGKMKKVTGKVE